MSAPALFSIFILFFIAFVGVMIGGSLPTRRLERQRREDEFRADLLHRVASLERRTANLETLLLEKDVEQRFADLGNER